METSKLYSVLNGATACRAIVSVSQPIGWGDGEVWRHEKKFTENSRKMVFSRLHSKGYFCMREGMNHPNAQVGVRPQNKFIVIRLPLFRVFTSAAHVRQTPHFREEPHHDPRPRSWCASPYTPQRHRPCLPTCLSALFTMKLSKLTIKLPSSVTRLWAPRPTTAPAGDGAVAHESVTAPVVDSGVVGQPIIAALEIQSSPSTRTGL